MPNQYTSLKYKNKKNINKICESMRLAKERKRLESPEPEYPYDRKDDYRIIQIEDSMNGRLTTHILMLTPAKNGRSNSWDVWLDAEYQGCMGWSNIMKLAQSLFLHIRTL